MGYRGTPALHINGAAYVHHSRYLEIDSYNRCLVLCVEHTIMDLDIVASSCPAENLDTSE